ncbi:MAG TPA: alanine:cation symporter family protein [Candidatus Corynebacterium avicola]|uniref:Alanine:cation symporter family protein n=1 Tax=Candidatus Corynebacterium avicola TaxID=2838527 RepID=A0A9D1ULG5_9CORY|nr:alanine:cation symporter family protein [Candidatus Corynebacterium avicola]
MSPDPYLIQAQDDTVTTGFQGVAETIDGWFGGIEDFYGGIIFVEVAPNISLIVLLAIVVGVSLTAYFGFIQFRKMNISLEVLKGKWSRKSDPGEVTHFQGLASALSATVGMGNVAGVAAAVSLGGPGATFWMICAGLVGMCTKFVECTLGVKYRKIDENGMVHGGPFQYLKVAFRKLGKVPVAILTGIFAIGILLFGWLGGGMFQANQAFAQVRSVTGGDDGFMGSDAAAIIFGLGMALLIALVIIGGIKSIATVAEKIVPSMAILYVVAGLVVLVANITNIPAAFGSIVEGAFSPEGVAGGVIGVMFIGFQRAFFSNEAGVGSAPIAHSAVKTRRPVSEGFNAMLEPFIDTVVVCTMTALIIIVADQPSYHDAREQAADGGGPGDIVVTSDAFGSVISWFPVVLAVAVFLFAFSTLITWSYYGIQAWRHLFGTSKFSDTVYRLVLCVLVVIGCIMSFSNIIDFADAALFTCIFVNMAGMLVLAPKVKEEMTQYLADRRAGKLMDDPEPLPHEREEIATEGEKVTADSI